MPNAEESLPTEHIGRFRKKLGWGDGRTAGARVVVCMPHGTPPWLSP
ncbi:hypothetical protein [Nocardia sp. MW-W600-9]